jgi:hypothetical protein
MMPMLNSTFRRIFPDGFEKRLDISILKTTQNLFMISKKHPFFNKNIGYDFTIIHSNQIHSYFLEKRQVQFAKHKKIKNDEHLTFYALQVIVTTMNNTG